MNIKITEFLRGCTFIMMLNRNVMLIAAGSCPEEALKANCSNKNFTNIPQDLNPNIESLDISNNKDLKDVTINSFKRYKNLKRLIMRDCKIPKLPEVALFTPLDNLEELDISGLQQTDFGAYTWPPKLRTLNVRATRRKDLNVADLVKLEYLDASDNEEMLGFPQLNPKAPLRVVLLHNNLMSHLTVENIAPHCHITTLGLRIHHDSQLYEPHKYCECVSINRWIGEFLIKSNNLGCKSKSKDEQCPAISPHLLALRRECIGGDRKSMNFLMGFAILFLIILTLVTLLFAYRYAKLRHHIRPIPHTEPPNDGEEEDEDEDEED